MPAKLGDVYRAYLVKVNNRTSASLRLGTIFIERVFDLFAIVVLGLAAGFWSFHNGMSPEVQLIFAIGIVVVAVLAWLVPDPQLRRSLGPTPAGAASRRRVLRPLRGGPLLHQRTQRAPAGGR